MTGNQSGSIKGELLGKCRNCCLHRCCCFFKTICFWKNCCFSGESVLSVWACCCCLVIKWCPTLQPYGLQPTRSVLVGKYGWLAKQASIYSPRKVSREESKDKLCLPVITGSVNHDIRLNPFQDLRKFL